MKDKTNRFHIIIYVLLVIVLSVLLLMLHSVFKNVGDYSVSFPQFAPALALIILLAVRGRKVKDFNPKRSFTISKKALVFCLCSALFLFAVFVVCGFVLSAFGKPFSQWGNPALAINILCLISGCIGEEIGWRGFLLPALNRNISLIVSSVVIGVFWGIWHLNFEDGIIGFAVYTLFTTTLSIIISWVQTKSGGSIIPAIAFHFFVNLFARVILNGRIGITAFLVLSAMFGAFGVTLFFADKKTFLSKSEFAKI